MPKINKATMTGTEFRAIREEMGLSQSDLAKILGIRHYTMLQRFETGEASIPDTMEEEIKEIYKKQRERTGALADKIVRQYKNFDTEDFYLILQPSHPEDNAAIRKAYLKMVLKGQPVHMVHLDKDSYDRFIKDTGLEHNEKTMQIWADWYYKNQFYLKRKNIIPKEPPRNMFRWQEEIHEWERED